MTCQNHLPPNLAFQSLTTTPVLELPSFKNSSQDILSVENLKQGMKLWQSHSLWDTDFHGQLYSKLQKLFDPSLSSPNWSEIIEVLWEWRAIRPCTKKFIYDRGLAVLPVINQFRQELLKKQPASWEQYEWSELQPFFETLQEIKNTTSPVFASKLAHFNFPQIFPVIDRDFIGVKESYASYWQRCRQLWQTASPEFKTQAQAELSKAIPQEAQNNYPWNTKITELCLSALPKH